MELSDEIDGQITLLCQAADNHLGAGEVAVAIERYEEAFALLPVPREQWEAATSILAALADAEFERQGFEAVRRLATRAMDCPGGLGNPFLHLRLGQAAFELGDSDRAKDELARAFMDGGDTVFEADDPKYRRFIRELLPPPEDEVGE